MKIDLTDIARTPGAHATHHFEEALARDPDVDLVEPARGSFSVTNTGRLLVLRGAMTAAVRLECARCCGPAVVALDIPLSEEFSARPAAESIEEQTIDVEEPDRAAFHENILDLTELVRQNVVINLPLQPLCREGCAGVCSRCGSDLNTGTCTCPPEEPHGPLAELKTLIERPD
ncbi:MAG: DUF177 domain-containing protein [Armatimonadota bacterium]|nr:MAG: DUF177 domain-containing protein [Armatimonadota bacterium]